MEIPKIPANEKQRLQALARYKVLDTPYEQLYDDITSVAALICQVPVSAITLLDENRQWFKSRKGIDATETPREISFCGHALHSPAILEVEDATQDSRFFDNPLVAAGPQLRFYAGAPLLTSDGYALGTLCVLDTVARKLTVEQKSALNALSRQVVAHLELRLSLRTLEENRIHFDNIAENVPGAISRYVVRADGQRGFTYLSPHAESIFELPVQSMIDDFSTASAMFDPDHVIAFRKEFALNLQALTPFRWEGRLRTPSGKVKWIQALSRPIKQDDGSVQWDGLLLDMTDKVEAENLLLQERARRIHSAKMAALGQMAGSVAHEINNPLTIIEGLARQLRRKELETRETSAETIASLEQIEKTVTRISKIVAGLRSFSRNDSRATPEEFSLATWLSETIELCRSRFKQGDVELQLVTLPELRLLGRPVQLSQVVLNLLNNAYDAVQSLPERWVKLDVEVSATSVRLSVTDSGKGLPPHLASQIMQPFFSTKQPGEGTGLGLSIATAIIEEHDGELRLDSGCANTRFVVELPLPKRGGKPGEASAA